jgi:hypothetical protein
MGICLLKIEETHNLWDAQQLQAVRLKTFRLKAPNEPETVRLKTVRLLGV